VLAGQGALAPGVALLDKPFTPSELAAKVRDILKRAHAA
jgi:DNA-binding response OmpR family regulator